MNEHQNILWPNKTIEMLTMKSICLCFRYDMSGNNIASHMKVSVHYEVVIGLPRTTFLHWGIMLYLLNRFLNMGRVEACVLQSSYLSLKYRELDIIELHVFTPPKLSVTSAILLMRERSWGRCCNTCFLPCCLGNKVEIP